MRGNVHTNHTEATEKSVRLLCVCVGGGGGSLGSEGGRQAGGGPGGDGGGGGWGLTGRQACRRNESYTRPNGTQFSILWSSY